jgi:2-iminobutanoate/2-iminopropanoate deaminase
MKTQIKTDQAPAADVILSQAIEANGLIFVSGQIHNTAAGEMITDSVEAKFEQIMKNCRAILAAAGSGLEKAVSVTIYVTDMSQMAALNAVYANYFAEPLPARAAICVKELPLGATIEVSMVAAA